MCRLWLILAPLECPRRGKKIHLTVTQVCRLHLCIHPGQKRLICLFSAKVVGQPSFFTEWHILWPKQIKKFTKTGVRKSHSFHSFKIKAGKTLCHMMTAKRISDCELTWSLGLLFSTRRLAFADAGRRQHSWWAVKCRQCDATVFQFHLNCRLSVLFYCGILLFVQVLI